MPALSPPVADPATSAEVKDWIAAEATGDPFLLLRDDRGHQTVLLLADRQRVTVGRRPTCDVCVGWDAKVSRVHAALERVGDSWVVLDDGLSHNGTFVNGERVTGRRRLADSDAIRVGRHRRRVLRSEHAESQPTVTSVGPRIARRITPAQRRLLVALCRPVARCRARRAATNREIAEELHLAEDSVKSGLRDLFPLFGVDDLPPNQKRAQLAVNAMRTGSCRAASSRCPVCHACHAVAAERGHPHVARVDGERERVAAQSQRRMTQRGGFARRSGPGGRPRGRSPRPSCLGPRSSTGPPAR